MSGSAFRYTYKGETKIVTFRVPRDANEKVLSMMRGNTRTIAVVRREVTCEGAKLAKQDDMAVRNAWKDFTERKWRGNKTISFDLTDQCQKIIDEFLANHPYIQHEEVAFQVLHKIGTLYGVRS